MYEQLMAVWKKVSQKATENKDLLIKVGCALGGALISAVITNIIVTATEEYELTEEDILLADDDDTED